MNKSKSWLIFSLVMVIIASFILSSCSSSNPSSAPASSAASSTPIKIGFINTLSGPFASSSDFTTPASQIVIDNINAQGGLLGRPVQLVMRDDAGDPNSVIAKANELKNEGCVAIIGPLLDACTVALNQWAKDNKMVVTLSTPSLSMRTTDFSRYSFHCEPSSWSFSAVLAKAIAEQNIKSIYFYGADMTFLHEVHDNLWTQLKKLNPGITDLGVTYAPMNQMDFSTDISTLLAKKPDMIVNGIGGPPFASFVQQGQQFNLFGQVKFAGTFMLGADTTTSFGKNYPQGFQSMTWSPFYLNEQPMQDFTKAFQSKSKYYPGDISMDFYLKALSLTEAIKKAGSTDSEKIIAAFETLTFDSPLGKISVHDYDHQLVEPLWYGVSGYSNDYPIAIGTNLKKYQDDAYPTKDEVTALRTAKK